MDIVNKEDYERAADCIIKKLGKGQFEQKFKELFDESKIKNIGLSNSMRILPEVFRNAVITTNFDKCIENAYSECGNPFSSVITPEDATSLNNYLVQISRQSAHFLWKIHGDIDCFEKRVLTSKEYDKTYVEKKENMEAINSFFQNNQILFLGCSLKGKDRYMDVLLKLGKNMNVTNYAILQKPKEKKEFDDYKKELSDHWIFPIWYPDDDIRHESVCIILRQLMSDMMDYDENVSDIDSTFSKNSIPDYLEANVRMMGIPMHMPKEEGIIIDDVIAICMGLSQKMSRDGWERELTHLMGQVYDKKYKNLKLLNDVRGHSDEWIEIFKDKAGGDSNQRVLVVGIGNGEEGRKLGYEEICGDESLIFCDIAEESLKKASKFFSKAKCINQSAQDLSRIESSSIDLYIALRVYQSTYFNIDKALYEASRVLKKNKKIIISVANGYISKEDNSYIQGLLKTDEKTIDRAKPHRIIEYIRGKLKILGYKKINAEECRSEIFICAIKS